MSENSVTLEQYQSLLKDLGASGRPDSAFLYQCFLDAMDSSSTLKDQSPIIAHMPINPVQLTLYLLYEHQFYLDTHSDRKLEDVEKDEGYEQFLISVVLDKYFTNEHLSYRSGSFANRFIPEISTINL